VGYTRKIVLAGAFLITAHLAGEQLVRRHETGGGDGPGKLLEVDGQRIHYVEAGAGPPVVLLHGLGASTFCFRRTIPALAAHFQVFAIDLPGYGFSSRDAPDQSLTAQTAYVLRFLDALGLDKVSLVGHSMGGSVAQRVAVAAPGRVDRLVLADATSDALLRRGLGVSRLLDPLLPPLFATVFYLPPLRRRWLALACYDDAYLTPDVLAGYGAPSRVPGHVRAYRRFFRDRARDALLDPSLIRQPTLLVWGEADRVTPPAIGRRLADQIEGSRLVVIPRAGHWAPEERPDIVNPLLVQFLKGETAVESA
jgi:pimeloyl-ACP methyl ester carboxylesterase